MTGMTADGQGGRRVRGCEPVETDSLTTTPAAPPPPPPCSAPTPTPTPSQRPGGAWGGAKLPQEAEGRAGRHSRRPAPIPLGSPARRGVGSPIPPHRGSPGPTLLHPPKPPLSWSLSDPLRSSSITFSQHAPPN